MNKMNRCPLIDEPNQLEQVIHENDQVIILFYASWCSYSNRFLPVFKRYAEEHGTCFYRVMLDDYEEIADQYRIRVYPTVLFFENGQVIKRLDGVSGVGLDEPKLRDFIRTCKITEEIYHG